MNTADFTAALERAGKIKGEPGVVAQKKLILENYMIVDDAGMAVDPDSLDVVVKGMPAAEKEPETDSALAEAVAKSVRRSLADLVVDRKFAVTANLDAKPNTPWETARVYGSIKNLKSKEAAYKFGAWCLAAMGHQKSAAFCKDNGLSLIRTKGHSEGVNSAGGFLVPLAALLHGSPAHVVRQVGEVRHDAVVVLLRLCVHSKINEPAHGV
jgi:hypothetical protein